MVIKRKDGSIYKLRGPNKLLIAQEFWNEDDKLLIHNFDLLSTVILGTPTSQPPHSDGWEAPKAAPVMEAPEPEPELILEPEPEPEPLPEPEAEELPEHPSTFRNRERYWLYCLPANQSKTKDQLYNQETIRTSFKDPFRFQGALAAYSDLRLSFWTTVEQITVKSVIFDPDEHRWWQIHEIQNDPSGDGVIATCVPSKLKPDFTSVRRV